MLLDLSLPRIARLVLLSLLLALCAGCIANLKALQQHLASSPPPPENRNSVQVNPPAATSTGVPAVTGAKSQPNSAVTIVPPVPTRKARPSRFTGPIDSRYNSRLITEDTMWRGQVLVEGALTIAPQATLTITPGTSIRFRPSPDGDVGCILIYGRLQAIGTKDHPITLTSDEVAPVPGDWQGIILLDSSKKNLLEWCRIEAAITGISVQFSDLVVRQSTLTRCHTGLSAGSSNVTITGGDVSGCRTGLRARDGYSALESMEFSGNSSAITVNGGSLSLTKSLVTGSELQGIEAGESRLHLESNRVVNNGSGMILNHCRGELTGNRIQDNRGTGLELADSQLRITGNRITGNGASGVVIRSGDGTLWNNVLEGNSPAELRVTGTEEIMAPGNWWGTADSARIRGRIQEGAGRVHVVPFLQSPPQLP